MARSQRTLVTPVSRPIVGIDLNGVLADVAPVMAETVRRYWNIELGPADRYDHARRRLIEAGHDERLVARWLKETVNDPDFILSLPSCAGSQEGWQALKRLPVELRIVTGHWWRPPTVDATRRWLELQGFDAPCDFTREKDGWCRQTRARWFVEDAPHRAAEVEQAGTRVLLVDQPYNAGASFSRVATLLDAAKLVWEDLGKEMP